MLGFYGILAVTSNGWDDNAAQRILANLLVVYALVCLVSAVGIIFAALLRQPALTLVMTISQVVAVLAFYATLLGPGEIHSWEFILMLLVAPGVFGYIWEFTRKRGRAAQRS